MCILLTIHALGVSYTNSPLLSYYFLSQKINKKFVLFSESQPHRLLKILQQYFLSNYKDIIM